MPQLPILQLSIMTQCGAPKKGWGGARQWRVLWRPSQQPICTQKGCMIPLVQSTPASSLRVALYLSIPAATVLHHLRALNASQLLEAALVPVGCSGHDDCGAQLPNDQHLQTLD